jgi:hypothetical protein
MSTNNKINDMTIFIYDHDINHSVCCIESLVVENEPIKSIRWTK